MTNKKYSFNLGVDCSTFHFKKILWKPEKWKHSSEWLRYCFKEIILVNTEAQEGHWADSTEMDVGALCLEVGRWMEFWCYHTQLCILGFIVAFFLDFLTLKYGTDRLSQYVSKELPLYAAYYPRRSQMSTVHSLTSYTDHSGSQPQS
jgi:hypothetical protein